MTNLKFAFDYEALTDKEVVRMITTVPHNEEAAVYLLFKRYDPLLSKIYREVYDKNPNWYEDCQSDLFDYLRGKNQDWHKLSTFKWRSEFPAWIKVTAKSRFLEIKPYLLNGVIPTVSTDDEANPVVIPDRSIEDYEKREMHVLLLEAIGLLNDPDQKFVVLKHLEGYKSREIAALMAESWRLHNVTRYYSKGNLVVPSAGYVDVRYERAKENLKEIVKQIVK